MSYDPQCIAALEPSQLSAMREAPLPRRHLGRGVMLLLVLLRAYVLAAIPVVAYAFIAALANPS
jgi:hypothetical protein